MFASYKESYDKPSQCINKQRYQFANRGLYGQSLRGCEKLDHK